MTDDQEKLLSEFHARIKQLMLFCNKLKSDNSKLSTQLEEKDAVIEELKLEVQQTKVKYTNLKMARSFSSNNEEGVNITKTRLEKLVRDIDKCIAMLRN